MIVGPVSEYNAEEGERVELSCSADANPPASQFEWLHIPTAERTTGQRWVFDAGKKHQGEFRCTAQNSIEMGTAKMTLNVMYGPQIRVKVSGEITTA